MTDTPDILTRSLTLDVIPPDNEAWRAVLESIQRYRAACRQVYAVWFTAQAAGATLDDAGRLKPDGARSARVLTELFETRDWWKPRTKKDGTTRELPAAVYDCRRWVLGELLPDAKSFVWDSLRRDVLARWKSVDPEFAGRKITRGWLQLQGARGATEFRFIGIPLPVATAKPQLEARGITLHWDRGIGPVTFRLPTLDRGRWVTWCAIRDGDWKLGTVYLNERGGKLRVTLSYSRPQTPEALDPERTLVVRFADEPESFMRIVGPDGEQSYDSVSAANAVGRLRQLASLTARYTAQRQACGAKRQPWSQRTSWLANQERLSRVTANRERFVRETNHAWSRRVASRAIHWRCGRIIISPRPETLFDNPWKWSELCGMIDYKCAEAGARVTVEPQP